MARPRLAGGTSFTGRLSMAIWPAVGLSSPATRRRSVDLPHPDGPTKTQNSRGRMSRSMFSRTEVRPKDLATPRSEMAVSAVAFMALTLHRAGGEARDDAALEDEDDERQGHDDRRRHDVSPGELVLAGAAHERDAHRHGALVVVQREGQREEELVPRGDERQEPGGDQR